mgnify:CR=1 FL=1
MRKSIAWAVVCMMIVAVGLVACGGGGGSSTTPTANTETWTIKVNNGASSYIFDAKAGGNYSGEGTSGCELCCSGFVDSWSVSSSGNLSVIYHCDIASGVLTGPVVGNTVSGSATCSSPTVTNQNWSGPFTGTKN